MAQKRMFDRAVIDTDRFMDLPVSAKALYFLLGMEADDEGFVSYKKVIRIHGGTEDDMKVLNAKNFIILFESGVVVITDWRKNNWLDNRRIKKTEYIDERELLALTKDNVYTLSIRLASAEPEEYRIEENRIEENRVFLAKDELSPEPSQASKDISEVIKLFEVVNPSVGRLYGNKTQRDACERLLKKWTIPQIKALVQGVLPELNADQFSKGKSITPLQFESNLGFIKAYIDKKNKGSSMVSV